MKTKAKQLAISLIKPSLFGMELKEEELDGLLRSLGVNRDTEEYITLLRELYSFTVGQDLAHIAATALTAAHGFDCKKSTSGEGEKSTSPYSEKLKSLRSSFEKQLMLSVARYHRLSAELNRVSEAFEAAKIKFIPLKGSVLRDYYPDPRLRTSCDIDILVEEASLNACEKLLTDEMSFEKGEVNAHDISYYSEGGVHLELHFALMEDFQGEAAKILSDVWNYSYPKSEGSSHYVMPWEMFYFYHIAHMAKHFMNGGCGIRPFMDIIIMNSGDLFDRDLADPLLSKAGLLQFALGAEALATLWFYGAEHTELTLAMENYILGAGIYGNQENGIAINQAKEGSRLRYILRRIFYSYDMLCNVYPKLKGHRWKTPFYQIKRWSNLITKKGAMARSVRELKRSGDISSSQSKSSKKLLKSLGLADK